MTASQSEQVAFRRIVLSTIGGLCALVVGQAVWHGSQSNRESSREGSRGNSPSLVATKQNQAASGAASVHEAVTRRNSAALWLGVATALSGIAGILGFRAVRNWSLCRRDPSQGELATLADSADQRDRLSAKAAHLCAREANACHHESPAVHDDDTGEDPTQHLLGPLVGKTVLIADDDLDIARTLSMRFQRLGMTTLRTPDALHALFGAHKMRPDLIILDVNMPSGNGLAVCEMLNGERCMAGTPIIVYTSCSSEVTQQRCRELGAQYVLKSPGSWDKVMAIVDRLFPNMPVNEQVRTAHTQEPTPSPNWERTAQATSEPGAATQGPIGLAAPFDVAEPAGDARRPPLTSPSTDSAQAIRSSRAQPLVLAIDDEPDISAAIAMRLSSHGVTVQRAFTGMQGYWTAVDSLPDVILCDMRMPDGEGSYIVGRLQSHPLTRDIPVVVISGEDNPGVKRRMLSMGVSAYLNKPIDMKQLLVALRQHIPLTEKPPKPSAGASAEKLNMQGAM